MYKNNREIVDLSLFLCYNITVKKIKEQNLNIMTIETLNQRIANAQAKLEKLNKKYERILKAEASNYEKDNPYYYSDYDKRSCERDIKELTNNIEKYTQMLTSEIEKNNSRDVKIIIDFLNNWKEKVYNYYKKDLINCFEERANLKILYNNYSNLSYSEKYELGENTEYHKAKHILYCKLNGYKERKSFINHWGKEDYHDVKVKDGEWEHLKYYLDRCDTLDDCLKLLDKELEQEKNRKYDFIIQRVNKIVGQITDAQNLKISGDGELNGIIYGTRGKASVETVGCAGYNIQVFHFRCYVREVK